MPKYIQAFLETADGLFAVSVVEGTAVDASNRITDAAAAFSPGSMIVAVEMGAGQTNESGKTDFATPIVEQPNPFDRAEKASGAPRGRRRSSRAYGSGSTW